VRRWRSWACSGTLVVRRLITHVKKPLTTATTRARAATRIVTHTGVPELAPPPLSPAVSRCVMRPPHRHHRLHPRGPTSEWSEVYRRRPYPRRCASNARTTTTLSARVMTFQDKAHRPTAGGAG